MNKSQVLQEMQKASMQMNAQMGAAMGSVPNRERECIDSLLAMLHDPLRGAVLRAAAPQFTAILDRYESDLREANAKAAIEMQMRMERFRKELEANISKPSKLWDKELGGNAVQIPAGALLHDDLVDAFNFSRPIKPSYKPESDANRSLLSCFTSYFKKDKSK